MNEIENQIWYHYNKCYNTAKGIMKSHDEACDVASESILRLLLFLKSGKSNEIEMDMTSYINQIVFNICRNIKRKRRNLVPINILEDDYNLGHSYNISFIELDIERVMESYPDETAKLIKMKIEGYSTKECADSFGTNENSMKVRWHRIKRKIKSDFD